MQLIYKKLYIIQSYSHIYNCILCRSIQNSLLQIHAALDKYTGRKKAPPNGRSLLTVQIVSYLEAFAALIASIIMGTTLNRSPQMP